MCACVCVFLLRNDDDDDNSEIFIHETGILLNFFFSFEFIQHTHTRIHSRVFDPDEKIEKKRVKIETIFICLNIMIVVAMEKKSLNITKLKGL